MASNNIRVTLDDTVYRLRAFKLSQLLESKKSSQLWPSIAATMAAGFEDKYSQGWGELAPLKGDYLAWKAARGFHLGKLEMRGDLKKHLTSSKAPIKRANSRELILSTEGVVDEETGEPYAGFVHDGFTATTPYGNTFLSPIRVPARPFMTTTLDDNQEEVEKDAAVFTGRMAQRVWGPQASRRV